MKYYVKIPVSLVYCVEADDLDSAEDRALDLVYQELNVKECDIIGDLQVEAQE